jgi:hypothetical protein
MQRLAAKLRPELGSATVGLSLHRNQAGEELCLVARGGVDQVDDVCGERNEAARTCAREDRLVVIVRLLAFLVELQEPIGDSQGPLVDVGPARRVQAWPSQR